MSQVNHVKDTTSKIDCVDKETGSNEIQSSILERKKVYEQHAETYHQRFRALIDFRIAEEPRQVSGIIFLFVLCAFGSYLSNEFLDSSTPRLEIANSIRFGFIGLTICVLIYSFLQTRDGLLVRPHPGFWRLWHGAGLIYLIMFCILACMPIKMGTQAISILLPGLNNNTTKDVFAGTCDLQCKFSMNTLKIQLTKMWFISHIIGWFAKMLIFRDWYFCMIFSISFELIELSFQWLIPELKECWWDSIILDFCVSNMIGMGVGVITLKLLKCLRYNWLHKQNQSISEHEGSLNKTALQAEASARRFLRKLLPFLWSPYHWSFFQTPERLFQAAVLLLFSLLAELNVFIMMYALNIPASHLFHKLRVTCLCFLAVSGVAETYQYLNHRGDYPQYGKRRIGHNAWLLVAIIVIETFVVLRYGQSRFNRIVPDKDVLASWAFSFILFSGWCYCHFVIVGTERLNVPKKVWLKFIELTRPGVIKSDVLKLEDKNFEEYIASKILQNDETSKIIKNEEDKTRTTTSNIQVVQPESEAVQCVFELLSLEHKPKQSSKSVITSKDLQILIKQIKQKRHHWGILYHIGSKLVEFPPLTCFLPLIYLTRFYDFD